MSALCLVLPTSEMVICQINATLSYQPELDEALWNDRLGVESVTNDEELEAIHLLITLQAYIVVRACTTSINIMDSWVVVSQERGRAIFS